VSWVVFPPSRLRWNRRTSLRLRTGYDGGEIMRRGLADRPIVVQSDYIPRIQEVQASIYHIICELLCEK
jgi:hypothetical protein